MLHVREKKGRTVTENHYFEARNGNIMDLEATGIERERRDIAFFGPVRYGIYSVQL